MDKKQIITLCAWCEEEKQFKRTNKLLKKGFLVSHGICKKHAKKLEK